MGNSRAGSQRQILNLRAGPAGTGSSACQPANRIPLLARPHLQTQEREMGPRESIRLLNLMLSCQLCMTKALAPSTVRLTGGVWPLTSPDLALYMAASHSAQCTTCMYACVVDILIIMIIINALARRCAIHHVWQWHCSRVCLRLPIDQKQVIAQSAAQPRHGHQCKAH